LCVAAAFFTSIISYGTQDADAIRSQAAAVESFQGKPRVFVLTGIGNEPDDQMSLTRFLLYSNEFDVEGLVATTSTWQRDKVSPDIIHSVLSNYGKIRSNLLKHTADFPTLDYLSDLVKSGQPAYGMAAVGTDKLTPGAQLLIDAGDRKDPRPLYVSVWGGANTLAQGLWHVRETRGPEEVRQFILKLRVYSSDQATIWRWREAFQHDFAARMDWTLKELKDANHSPVVVVNGDETKEPVFIKAKVGTP
jgi:hypothetical protein